ncbi:MAG: carbon storage regulator [Planctomycetales bacterium]|nr:carbon storage regulator [Planctomycetales bacterium]
MLVLTRKQNEKIRIGSSIVITVVRMKGKAVRLGIEAPGDVSILRGELAFETSEQEELASKPASPANREETPAPRETAANAHRNSANHWPAEKNNVVRAKANPADSTKADVSHPMIKMAVAPTSGAAVRGPSCI